MIVLSPPPLPFTGETGAVDPTTIKMIRISSVLQKNYCLYWWNLLLIILFTWGHCASQLYAHFCTIVKRYVARHDSESLLNHKVWKKKHWINPFNPEVTNI